jgi:hypothetical protein
MLYLLPLSAFRLSHGEYINRELMQERSRTGLIDILNLARSRFHFYTAFQRRKRWDAVHRLALCAVPQCIG